MAPNSLSDYFGLRPVPRKSKFGKTLQPSREVRTRKALHSAAPGNICIYVMGPADQRASKVGVSNEPYRRMLDHETDKKLDLFMCYFAEVTRAEGFAIETVFHKECRRQNIPSNGEWVALDRSIITPTLRVIMANLRIKPVLEVGDTSDDRETIYDPGFIPSRTGGMNMELGVTPAKSFDNTKFLF